jgi:hypothetical protein
MSDPAAQQRAPGYLPEAFDCPTDLAASIAQGDLDLAYEQALALWALFADGPLALRDLPESDRYWGGLVCEDHAPGWPDLYEPPEDSPWGAEPWLAVGLLSLELTRQRWRDSGFTTALTSVFPCLAAARPGPAQAGCCIAPSMTEALYLLTQALSVSAMPPLQEALILARLFVAATEPRSKAWGGWEEIHILVDAFDGTRQDYKELAAAAAKAPADQLRLWAASKVEGMNLGRAHAEIEQEFFRAAVLRRRLGLPSIGPSYEEGAPLRGLNTSATEGTKGEDRKESDLSQRLQFDAATHTVTLDGQRFENLDPVPFLVLQKLAQKWPGIVTDAELAEAPLLHGKKFRRELQKLPAPLFALVRSRRGKGRWLALPPPPGCPKVDESVR